MAVIIPLGDSQARGALADTTIFQRRRGQVFVKKYATPSNPNSAGQQDQRIKFQWAIQAWQDLSSADKDLWRANATGKVQTGYNLFVRWYLVYGAPSRNPLLIKNCSNWEITNLRSSISTGWFVNLYSTIYSNPYYLRVDNNNTLWTFEPSKGSATPTKVRLLWSGELINIPAGDTFKATFDGAQTQLIYCPAFVDATSAELFVSDDGSTFWDVDLTQLAYSAPK